MRSPDRKNEIYDALQKHRTPTDNLDIFTANLTEDEGWDEAMKGCDYLMHVASPLTFEKESEEYFVGPAVAGVQRAFRFAKKHNVKRFTGILSTCMYPDVVDNYPMTEKDVHLGAPADANFSYGFTKRS